MACGTDLVTPARSHSYAERTMRLHGLMPPTTALVFGLIAALLTACGDPPDPRVPVGPQVDILLDGAPLLTVDATAIGERLFLSKVMPPAARDQAHWVMLEAHARDGRRRLGFQRPAERYPKQDFCLYVSKDGAPSFGVYRRDDPDLHPRLRELLWQPAPYLEDVERVTIRTTETRQETQARRLHGTLAIVVDGGEGAPITEALLDTVTAIETPPKEAGEGALRGRPGLWWLGDVIRLVVAPARVRRAQLVDIKGNTHKLPIATLGAEAKLRAALKRNRAGDHHVRFLEGGRRVSTIRSVVRLEIRTRD